MTTVVLQGITITTGLVWQDKNQYAPVEQVFRRTLGGTPVVDYAALSEGRPVTLSSLRDQGWLTKTQVDAIQALADVAGAVYPLTIGSESFQVMFRHHEPPAVEFDPLIPRTEAEVSDWYLGNIKLFTV